MKIIIIVLPWDDYLMSLIMINKNTLYIAYWDVTQGVALPNVTLKERYKRIV